MRNRWGVEIKKGNWVIAHHPRGGMIEGRITKIVRDSDPYVSLDSGYNVAIDDITQTLGPMTVAKDGTVRQNPLTRVRVTSPPQRPAGNSEAPSPRLKTRRRRTAKAPKGVYANPVDVGDMRDASSYAQRATRSMLDARLAELSKLIKAPAYPASGSLILEKNAGGFRLVQIASGTAERDLSERMNMGQMLTYLDGALMVARAVR